MAKIEECAARNTTSAFRAGIARRANYVESDHETAPGSISRLCVRIRAFSPSCLLTEHRPFVLGDAATGEVASNCGGGGRSHLDFWRPESVADCQLCAPDTSPVPHFGDFDEWSLNWTPVLSGPPHAIDEPRGSAIAGARLFRPGVFIRGRRERINREDATPALNWSALLSGPWSVLRVGDFSGVTGEFPNYWARAVPITFSAGRP